MAFTRRRIDLQFRLGTGAFGQDGANTVSLQGLRTIANISKAGGVSMSRLELRVFGMDLDVMNRLTILNKLRQYDTRFNTVTVSAGDNENGTAVCFQGIIMSAWADLSGAPDSVFVVTAQSGYLDALRPIAPTSYTGSVDVATVIAGIGEQMQPKRALENSGVNIRIASPYLPGTAMAQLTAISKAANINCVLDSLPTRGGEVIAIWPAGLTRNGQVPVISAATGLVSWPRYTQNGIQLTTLYNPSLTFGQRVEVRSQLTPANGQWAIASVTHNLSAEMPGGPWFTQVDCALIGQVTPIIS